MEQDKKRRKKGRHVPVRVLRADRRNSAPQTANSTSWRNVRLLDRQRDDTDSFDVRCFFHQGCWRLTWGKHNRRGGRWMEAFARLPDANYIALLRLCMLRQPSTEWAEWTGLKIRSR